MNETVFRIIMIVLEQKNEKKKMQIHQFPDPNYFYVKKRNIADEINKIFLLNLIKEIIRYRESS